MIDNWIDDYGTPLLWKAKFHFEKVKQNKNKGVNKNQGKMLLLQNLFKPVSCGNEFRLPTEEHEMIFKWWRKFRA